MIRNRSEGFYKNRWFSNLLIVCMTTLVVLAVSNGCESFGAELALVWLFASMGFHVDEKVAFFSKNLATVRNCAFEQILSGMRRFNM